jgi:hypothetical protein
LAGQEVEQALLYRKYPEEHLLHEVFELHNEQPVGQVTHKLELLETDPYVPLGQTETQVLFPESK